MEFKIVRVMNVKEIVKKRKEMLELDIDYLLLSLHEAMQAGNEAEKNEIKYQLECIMEEIEILQA